MERLDQVEELTLDMIPDLVKNPTWNFTVNKLLFLETRQTEKMPRKVFPCYIMDYAHPADDESKVYEMLVCIIQFMKGEPQMITTTIHAEEVGVSRRFWKMPPSDTYLDSLPPMLDSVVKQ